MIGLKDYVVFRDHFDPDTDSTMAFPCCSCTHRHGLDTEDPCRTCDHNGNAVPDHSEVNP